VAVVTGDAPEPPPPAWLPLLVVVTGLDPPEPWPAWLPLLWLTTWLPPPPPPVPPPAGLPLVWLTTGSEPPPAGGAAAEPLLPVATGPEDSDEPEYEPAAPVDEAPVETAPAAPGAL
jgi:hypothetical protein